MASSFEEPTADLWEVFAPQLTGRPLSVSPALTERGICDNVGIGVPWAAWAKDLNLVYDFYFEEQ